MPDQIRIIIPFLMIKIRFFERKKRCKYIYRMTKKIQVYKS